jgi:hypothetical protein
MIIDEYVKKTFNMINSMIKINDLYELLQLSSCIYDKIIDICVNRINKNEQIIFNKEILIILIYNSELCKFSQATQNELFKICFILESNINYIDITIIEYDLMILYLEIKVISIYIQLQYNKLNINLTQSELDLIYNNLFRIFGQNNICEILEYTFNNNRYYFDIIVNYILYHASQIESSILIPMDID